MSDTTPALFVGLDVSLAETHVCVLDQFESRVFEGVVVSDPDALASLLAERAPDCSSIATETARRRRGSGASFASGVSR